VTSHPIEETLARLAAANEDYRTTLLAAPHREPGWLSTAAWAAPGTPHLDELLTQATAYHKASSQQPAVSLWFGHYAFTVMAVAITCYLVEQRVPDLSPENVWMRVETEKDMEPAFAWRGRVFAALVNDPNSTHPDCIALPSREALREYLRASLVAHLTPMVDALRACSSFGKPGLWALAADSAASAFTWIGERIGNPALGLEEARLFNAAPSRLQRKRDFIHVEHCGLHYEMTDRASCCLYYKVEGGRYCSSCPHRPQEERIGMIKNWLERRAMGVVEE
jgi:ferric iron reductase protein FhuF